MSVAADVAAIRALRALEEQAVALADLSLRVRRASDLAPARAESDWRGLAQEIYELGLTDLRTTIASASFAVDDAVHATRRAAATLSARVE